MKLLPDEKVLHRYDEDLILTTHPILVGEPEGRNFVSIMLEQICSVEIVGRSFRWLLIMALVLLVSAAVFGSTALNSPQLDSLGTFQRYAYYAMGGAAVFLHCG